MERVNSHVEIARRRTGKGIKPEFLPFVFERFRQGDASTTRRHGGLGLGLSIVKHLVELHGGSVRVKSPGERLGATFIVRLPVSVVCDDGGRRRARVSFGDVDVASVALPSLAGVTALVVDDEADARELVSGSSKIVAADASRQESASEALEAIAKGSIDMLVSDIGMPDVDGYQLVRRSARSSRPRAISWPSR